MFSTASAPPRPWLRHAQRGLVLGLCLALGLQWALLQGIAWTQMFIDFASEGSVIEAVEKTFDGQHACKLCKKVQEGTQDSSQKKSSRGDDSGKTLNAVLVNHGALVPPAAERMFFAPLDEALVHRNGTPEPPPPRRGLV